MSLLADGFITYFWDLRASKVHADGSDGASSTRLQYAMREYTYRVDGEGRIFHDGSEIVDAATLRFFLLALQRTPEGRWLALCQGERNWFEAADTPFVIQRLTLRVTNGQLDGADLCLAGDYREALNPATLQQLAPWLVEDVQGPALVMGGRRYALNAERATASPTG